MESIEIRDEHVQLSHGKVHYRIEGKRDDSKRLVVCVHGIGSYSYCWKFLSNYLASTGRYTVLSFGKYLNGNSI